MIVIKAYSDTVKKSFGSSMSQGRFMREVFKVSGYDRFPSSSDEDYAKKICNGSKPITEEMIAGFPQEDVEGSASENKRENRRHGSLDG